MSRPGQRAHAPAHVSAPHPPPSAALRLSPQVGKVVEKFSSWLFVCLLLFSCLSGFYARLLVARTNAQRRREPEAEIRAHSRLLSLPPRAAIPPRRIRFSLVPQCATVAARGETWTRVGGRYFSPSGSVVSDCAGPLSGFFFFSPPE